VETHKLSEELIETVYLYAYKRVSNYEEARDLAQEIILEAFLETKRNRVQKDFYAWLWRMAHNKYVDFLRRKNRTDYQLDFDTDEEFITSNLNGWNSIEMDLINNEEIQNLYQSIERLSEVHRETIIRFYLRDQSISEISEALNIPEMQRILLPNIRKDLVPMFLNQNMYNVFLIRTNFFDWCCKNKLVETPEDFGSYTGGLSLVFEEPTKVSLEDGICSIGENQFKAKYIGKSDKTWEAVCDHLDFWILENAWEKLCHNQRGKDMIGEFVFPEPLKPETVYAVRFVNKDGSTSLGFYTKFEEEPVSFPGMQPSKMAQKIFV